MKAMLLAAGYGERMLPITTVVPKPLIPVLGRPLAPQILSRLAAEGIDEVVINLHHLPERLRGALGDGSGLRAASALFLHRRAEAAGNRRRHRPRRFAPERNRDDPGAQLGFSRRHRSQRRCGVARAVGMPRDDRLGAAPPGLHPRRDRRPQQGHVVRRRPCPGATCSPATT